VCSLVRHTVKEITIRCKGKKTTEVIVTTKKRPTTTNMASIVSNKEWLREYIENGSIRFYPFKDFIDPVCIGGGGYGVVFKAKAKTLSRTVAYKILFSQNEDEVFENFVKEVSSHDDGAFKFGCYVYLIDTIIL